MDKRSFMSTAKAALHFWALSIVLLMCPKPMHATSATYNFLTSATTSFVTGTTFTDPASGAAVSASAWRLPTASGSAIVKGYMKNWNGFGIGMCPNSNDCGTPLHQIDNVDGAYEFILFQFSRPMFGFTLQVDPYNASYDRDVTFFTGNLAPNYNLTGLTLDDLLVTAGLARRNDDSTASTAQRTVQYGQSTGFTALLIGSRIAGDASGDRYKMEVLTVATPEPATYLQVGIVLFGMLFAKYLRKRRC